MYPADETIKRSSDETTKDIPSFAGSCTPNSRFATVSSSLAAAAFWGFVSGDSRICGAQHDTGRSGLNT